LLAQGLICWHTDRGAVFKECPGKIMLVPWDDLLVDRL
jgi:hypothetical protein